MKGIYVGDNMGKVRIGGFEFPQKMFKKNLEIFKESLAHTSLSCERSFEELNQAEEDFKKIKEYSSNKKVYQSLPQEDKEEIDRLLKFFVNREGYRYGVINKKVETPESKENEELYNKNFSFFNNYIYNYLVFDSNKKLNQQETFKNVMELFKVIPTYHAAFEKAHNMKKDHLEAFDYALSLDHIGLKEIIEINTIINQNQPEKEIGFKQINNAIHGAEFSTIDKEAVPTLMAELLYKYDNNFGEEIPDINDKDLTPNERQQAMYKICKKEAIFHIQFERIHPFTDGNGRTGRVILNRNLIKQGLAPVLINKITMDKYKKYINEQNYDELTEWIMENSTQTLTPWISELRILNKISPDSIETIKMKR